MRTLNVTVHYVPASISMRGVSYQAYDENTLDGESPVGFGATEDAAGADLAQHPRMDDWTAEELVTVELESQNNPYNLAFVRHYRETYKESL